MQQARTKCTQNVIIHRPHDVTLRRPTLQLRCLAGLTVLPAAAAFDRGGLADCMLSDLPGRLLPLFMAALKPIKVTSCEQ